MAQLQLNLLGVPEIWLNGRLLDIRSRTAQAVLYYLASTQQKHTRLHVANLFWSDERALRRLRDSLTHLRHQVPTTFWSADRYHVAFMLNADYELDALRLEAVVQRPFPTPAELAQVLTQYRSLFLDQFYVRRAQGFSQWMQQQQAHYERLTLRGLHSLAVYYGQKEAYDEALKWNGRYLEINPYQEQMHRLQIILCALSGQRKRAFEHYDYLESLANQERWRLHDITTRLYQMIEKNERSKIQQLLEAYTLPLTLKTETELIPLQMPNRPRQLVGRQAEIQRIEQYRKKGQRVIGLVGMGGIGKTALAVHLAHNWQAQFPDGILWANLRAADPMRILADWANAFGVSVSQANTLKNRAALVRGILAHKKLLLILDDVEERGQVTPLLPSTLQCQTLITTRSSDVLVALNAAIVSLAELPQSESLQLLVQILDQERVMAEPTAARIICQQLAHLPLAVEIVAQWLASRPRYRLARMAEQLQATAQPLSLLQISDRAVRTSFEISWQSLSETLQTVFGVLGLWQGRPFTAQAVAYVLQAEALPIEDALFSLVALSLLKEYEENHYQQHRLLAQFACEKAEITPQRQQRFANFYLRWVQAHQQDDVALQIEWGNIHTSLSWSSGEIFVSLLQQVTPIWHHRADFTEARQFYEKAQTIMNAHPDLSYSWGVACLEQKAYAEAETYFQHSLAHDPHTASQAKTYMALARLALEQTRYGEMWQWLENGRLLWQTLHHQQGIAQTHYLQARLNYFQNQYQQTIELAEQARLIQKNHRYDADLILTHNLLASAYLALKNYDKAFVFAQDGLKLCQQVGNVGEEASILSVLADVYRQQGNLPQAKQAIHTSLHHLNKIGDMGSLASALFRLSLIQEQEQQFDDALHTVQQSLQLAQQIDYQLLLGTLYLHIGDLQQQMGQASQAQLAWETAQNIAQTQQQQWLLNALTKRYANP